MSNYIMEEIQSFVQLNNFISNLSDEQKADSVTAAKCANKFLELFQVLLNSKVRPENDGLTQNQHDLDKRKEESIKANECYNKIKALPLPNSFREDFLKLQSQVDEICKISSATAGLNTRMNEILNEANLKSKQNQGCMVVIALFVISTVCLFLI